MEKKEQSPKLKLTRLGVVLNKNDAMAKLKAITKWPTFATKI